MSRFCVALTLLLSLTVAGASGPSEVRGEGEMIIWGGSAQRAEAEAQREELEQQSAFRGILNPFHPVVLESKEVKGLKPGFFVVALGVCSKEQLTGPLTLLKAIHPGVYVRTVTFALACPGLVSWGATSDPVTWTLKESVATKSKGGALHAFSWVADHETLGEEPRHRSSAAIALLSVNAQGKLRSAELNRIGLSGSRIEALTAKDGSVRYTYSFGRSPNCAKTAPAEEPLPYAETWRIDGDGELKSAREDLRPAKSEPCPEAETFRVVVVWDETADAAQGQASLADATRYAQLLSPVFPMPPALISPTTVAFGICNLSDYGTMALLGSLRRRVRLRTAHGVAVGAMSCPKPISLDKTGHEHWSFGRPKSMEVAAPAGALRLTSVPFEHGYFNRSGSARSAPAGYVVFLLQDSQGGLLSSESVSSPDAAIEVQPLAGATTPGFKYRWELSGDECERSSKAKQYSRYQVEGTVTVEGQALKNRKGARTRTGTERCRDPSSDQMGD